MRKPHNIAIALLAGVLTASATDKPTANVDLTEIVANEKKPISRAEILVTNMPMNLSLYTLMEYCNNNGLYKARGQYTPFRGIHKGINYSVSLTAQHIDGTSFDAHQEAGAILSLDGKPTEDTFVKAIFRYFPSKSMDAFIITDINGVKTEILPFYDLKQKKGFVRSALNIPITNNIDFRLEGRQDLKNGNLKSTYGGFGVQARF